jgi:hypothetical protein
VRRVLSSVLWLASMALIVLSLPTVPDQVAAWSPVLQWVNDAGLIRWVLPIAGWVGLAALAGSATYRSRRSRSLLNTMDDRLAGQIRAANRARMSMVSDRYAAIRDRPAHSHARSYFGPPDYEDETVSIYRREHMERIAELIDKAAHHGYATETDTTLAGNVRDLDDLWVLSSRADQIARRLVGQLPPIPQTLDAEIGTLLQIGRNVIRAINRGERADGLLRRPPKTAYQVLREWWNEAGHVLRFNATAAFDRLSPEPTRGSPSEDIEAFIARGLEELETLRAE